MPECLHLNVTPIGYSEDGTYWQCDDCGDAWFEGYSN